MKRLFPLLALLAVAALAVAATCDDAAPAARSEALPATSVPATAVASAPRPLPITPPAVEYEVVDPAFDALPGARALAASYEGGGYRIEVPDAWNGDVVYFAHGFRGNPGALTVSFPPEREYLIERGFAWAASSYTKNGYEPGVAAHATYALREVFEREVGAPRRSYLYGQSMGGHVVTLLMERYPAAYDGALAECGVVSGREILDYFMSWAALSQYFTGVDFFSFASDAESVRQAIEDDVVPALGTAQQPTDAGRAFMNAVMHLGGGPRPFFVEGYAEGWHGNFAILAAAVQLAGPPALAAQNIDARYVIDDGLGYTSARLDRDVPRFASAPEFLDAAAYPEFAPVTGRIARPLLTVHNTGDVFVPIGLERSYRRAVDGAGAGDLLVQRAVRRPGHCNFTSEERRRAIDDLVTWVETGVAPPGDDLRGDLSDAGRAFTSPLEPDDPGTLRP